MGDGRGLFGGHRVDVELHVRSVWRRAVDLGGRDVVGFVVDDVPVPSASW